MFHFQQKSKESEDKKDRTASEKERARERANYSGFKYFTLHRILCIN